MSAHILDGRVTAKAVRGEIAGEVSELAPRAPGLGVILVGDNPASLSYVRGKEKACEEVGIISREVRLSAECSEAEIVEAVRDMNADTTIDGILVQLPLPEHVRESFVLAAISPDKDVDGLHESSLGALMKGEPRFIPCTPFGIVTLLEKNGIQIGGKHVVILGRSTLVGKSLANLMLRKGAGGDATVTVCHSRTGDMAHYTKQADILVVAIGRPGTVTREMVRPGTIVVDVGVNRVEDPSRRCGYRLVGDVEFEPVSQIASAITPVPGGVGPMTITMLLRNTLESAKKRLSEEKNDG